MHERKSTLLKPTLILLTALPVLPLFAPWQMFPVTSFHQEWLAIAAGLLACLCAWPMLHNTTRLAVPVIVWLPLALAGFILLQMLWLPHVIAQHGGLAVGYLLWTSLLIVLVGLLRQTIGRRRLSHWLAGGVLAAALWAAGREMAARLWAEVGIWGGTGQPNHYGDLLALGAASLLYLHAGIGLRKTQFVSAGLVLALGLSLTPSRSVWLYGLALAVIAWRYRSDYLKPLALGLIAYFLFQALWAFDIFPNPQTTSAEKIVANIDGSSPRWHIWTVAWDLFLQRPLFGHGFGEFDWAYYQAGRYLTEQATRIEHAHNIVMHLLVELGLLPVLLMTGAALVWLRGLLMPDGGPVPAGHDEIEEPGGGMDDAFRAWVLMLAAVLAVHSLLEYPLWHAHFLGVAAWLLAIGERRSWNVPMAKTGAAFAGGVVSLALAAAVIHEWQYTRMELALLNALASQSVQREQQLIDICQEIPDTAPLLLPYVPVVFTLTGHPENPAMREQMKVLAEAAVRFTPSQSLVYRLSLLQALNGDNVNARQTIDRALAAYPKGAVAFAEELLRIQAYAVSGIDVLMAQLLPVVNTQLQSNLPDDIKATIKRAMH